MSSSDSSSEGEREVEGTENKGDVEAAEFVRRFSRADTETDFGFQAQPVLRSDSWIPEEPTLCQELRTELLSFAGRLIDQTRGCALRIGRGLQRCSEEMERELERGDHEEQTSVRGHELPLEEIYGERLEELEGGQLYLKMKEEILQREEEKLEAREELDQEREKQLEEKEKQLEEKEELLEEKEELLEKIQSHGEGTSNHVSIYDIRPGRMGVWGEEAEREDTEERKGETKASEESLPSARLIDEDFSRYIEQAASSFERRLSKVHPELAFLKPEIATPEQLVRSMEEEEIMMKVFHVPGKVPLRMNENLTEIPEIESD